eukprot:11890606-Prorocentrum_lima.AAC.1
MRANEFGELLFIDHVELVADTELYSTWCLSWWKAYLTWFGLAHRRTRLKRRRSEHFCGARTSSW